MCSHTPLYTNVVTVLGFPLIYSSLDSWLAWSCDNNLISKPAVSCAAIAYVKLMIWIRHLHQHSSQAPTLSCTIVLSSLNTILFSFTTNYNTPVALAITLSLSRGFFSGKLCCSSFNYSCTMQYDAVLGFLFLTLTLDWHCLCDNILISKTIVSHAAIAHMR